MALILPVFISLMIGILDVGWALFAYQSVGNAARLGTRYAIVHGNNWYQYANAPQRISGAKVESYLLENGCNGGCMPGLDPTAVTVETTWQDQITQKPGDWVQVQVSYDFHFIFLPAGIPAGSVTMSSRSRMYIYY
jgi:Flp pilus assembly protein TadG